MSRRLHGSLALCLLFAIVGSSGLRAQESSSPKAEAGLAPDSLLVQRERAQWDALKAQDTTTFARLLGGNVIDVDVSGIRATSPGSIGRYVRGCKTANVALTDLRVAHYATTAVVTYKAAVEATCWGQKAPSPLYVLTVYEQRENGWRPVAHSETPAAFDAAR